MRRWILTLCTLAMILSAVVTPAFAAKMHCRRGTPGEGNQTACSSFVDADDDGICDNRTTECRNSFVDEDSDGICDNQGEAQSPGVRCGRASGGQGRHCRKNR